MLKKRITKTTNRVKTINNKKLSLLPHSNPRGKTPGILRDWKRRKGWWEQEAVTASDFFASDVGRVDCTERELLSSSSMGCNGISFMLVVFD